MVKESKEYVTFITEIVKKQKEVFIFALLILVIFSVHLVYLLQFQSTPLALVTSSGLDTALNHRLAVQILEGYPSSELIFASFYTYFLASLYRIFGIRIEVIRVIQLIIGMISCILIYLIAKKLFDKNVGRVALVFYGLYSPLIFQECLLVSTTLGILLSLILTGWVVYIKNRPHTFGYYIAGLILGLLCKTVNVALPLTLIFAFWIIKENKGVYLKIRKLLSFALGTLTIFSIFFISNLSVSNEALLLPAHSGINFYIGNNLKADGTFHPPFNMHASQSGLLKDSRITAEKKLGRPLNNNEINLFWFKQGFNYIISRPYSYLRLTVKKFFIFINGYEPADIEDFYFAKKFVPLLRFPFISFYFIAPLGILGWFIYGRKENSSLIKLFILGYATSNIFYFVTSRYRLPAIPYFIILASCAIIRVLNILTKKSLIKTAGLVCLLFLIFFITNIKIFNHDFSSAFYNLSIKYLDTDNLNLAEESTQEALRINPDLTDGYFNLGVIYYRKGKINQALENFLKTIQENPNYFEAYYNLGFIHEKAGNLETAVKYYLAALSINPLDEQAYINLGCAYLKMGKTDAARNAFHRATLLNPGLIDRIETTLPK